MQTHKFECLQARQTAWDHSLQATTGDFWSQCLYTLEGPSLWHFRGRLPPVNVAKSHSWHCNRKRESGSMGLSPIMWNLILNIDNLKNISILLTNHSGFMISGLNDSYTDFLWCCCSLPSFLFFFLTFFLEWTNW